MSGPRLPESATIVIFGASGDLTRRKLVPALWRLSQDGQLPDVSIVGCARSELSDDEFRQKLKEGLAKFAKVKNLEKEVWTRFSSRIHYLQYQYDDVEAARTLAERLKEIETKHGLSGSRLFYLSTPPSVFAPVIENLGVAGLLREENGNVARVVIEKPFGTDLESARSLNRKITSVLEERQIFRIDHYLGKETVQNLLVFRFANGIFEPLWNSRYVDHIQITGAETLGVEGRGSYFEKSGILRDMVQNHLFQVLSLAAMEPPASLAGDAVRNEKVKVLQALRPVEMEQIDRRVVRGQYTAGTVGGEPRRGYREEPGVSGGSHTETFVALKLFIDNWRWANVPFYLRSGKRMPKKVTEVAIHFKAAPHRIFGGDRVSERGGNMLVVRIQPDEGIDLTFGSKVPGPGNDVSPVTMQFSYSSFGVEPPEAYERLLLDALMGDGTLFIRGDEAEASWKYITPIHEAWAEGGSGPHPYWAGTWGPEAAHAMLASAGHVWRRP